MTALPLVWRLALRDLKGAIGSFRVFAACLILGVAAIAGVSSLTESIVTALRHDGKRLLGGDIELRLSNGPLQEGVQDYLRGFGSLSETQSIRAMIHNPATDMRTLAEIKAVDDSYPLYGSVDLRDGAAFRDAVALEGQGWGVALAPELADRLEIAVGDHIYIGSLRVEFRGIIAREPDRANDGFELAPRVLMHRSALAETGLLQEGSLVRFAYRLKLEDGVGPDALEAALADRYPEADWRLRSHENSAPRLRDFMLRLGQFLTLVGVTTLLVGGVGIAGGVRSYLDGKTAIIATLKTLGAESGMISRLYISQIMFVAVCCIVIGLVIGAFLPTLAAGVLSDRLPIAPEAGFYPLALLKAALYGVLVVLLFALVPVTRAKFTPAAALFRNTTGDQGLSGRGGLRTLLAALVLLIAAVPLLDADNRFFIFVFELGALAALVLLAGVGFAIRALVAALPRPKNVVLRLAFGNIHRVGAPTVGIVLALGLGLTLFATLALVEGNLGRQIRDSLPEKAPSFFFIDIQRDQIADFTAVAEGIPGVIEFRATPYRRGQVTHVKGVPAEAAEVAPDARWVLRGDRGLTFSKTPPDDNRITAGAWWPDGYDGRPQISFDAELARGLDVGLGDTLTINVLGREIEAEIASLRQIEWGTMGINFAIMFDPHTLEVAPYTYLATLVADPGVETEAYRTLTGRFPNVSAVRMKDVLGEVNAIISDMAAAVRAASVITILAGILVLAGATAAGIRDRLYDATILKVLGATRHTILAAIVSEYLLLGLLTGVVAAGIGAMASWLIVVRLMDFDWVFLPGAMILTLLGSIALTVVFGFLGALRALRVRPAAALRADYA